METVVSYSSLSMTVTIVVPRGGEWSKQKGGAPIGAIVGGMLGAVVVLTLGLALLLWWMRRTRRASHLEDGELILLVNKTANLMSEMLQKSEKRL